VTRGRARRGFPFARVFLDAHGRMAVREYHPTPGSDVMQGRPAALRRRKGWTSMGNEIVKRLLFWRKPALPDLLDPLRAALAPSKAQRLGQYEVVREIGRGSMGIVYLGRDTKNGRDVALKTMSLASEFDHKALADAKARFMREAEFLDTLNHPNIVDFYSAGEAHGMAYIAMEYLRGVELTQHTRPGNLLPLPVLLEIMEHAAEALAYAHGKNIVHRDVKPGNIMYDAATHTTKVADFGISRLTNLSRTRSGVVLGSPIYMSPEQVRGQRIDGQSDLFSLGAMFFQLACGHLPFDGETDMQVMFRIVQEPHPDIRAFRAELPPCVCAIIHRALEKDTALRYRSGHELAEDLRRCRSALQGNTE
jgi:eukaryotic-like serine/threonine-protein kinase